MIVVTYIIGMLGVHGISVYDSIFWQQIKLFIHDNFNFTVFSFLTRSCLLIDTSNLLFIINDPPNDYLVNTLCTEPLERRMMFMPFCGFDNMRPFMS